MYHFPEFSSRLTIAWTRNDHHFISTLRMRFCNISKHGKQKRSLRLHPTDWKGSCHLCTPTTHSLEGSLSHLELAFLERIHRRKRRSKKFTQTRTSVLQAHQRLFERPLLVLSHYLKSQYRNCIYFVFPCSREMLSYSINFVTLKRYQRWRIHCPSLVSHKNSRHQH